MGETSLPQEVLAYHAGLNAMPPHASPSLTTTDPLHILQEVFGYPAFRGAQQAIIDHVAGNGDALVLMPTGGGKSLCYQVPAIARHRGGQGVAVVVSPLIALMHDQVGALEEAGVHAWSCISAMSGLTTTATPCPPRCRAIAGTW